MSFINCIIYAILLFSTHLLIALFIQLCFKLRFDESCAILFGSEIVIAFISLIMYLCTNS